MNGFAAALRGMVVAAALALGGCAVAPEPNSLTHDPFEEANRAVHEVNVSVDRTIYRPVARSWGRTTPAPLREGIRNLSTNWKLPHHALQYVLQGRPGLVATSGARFLVNSTIGLAGLFDPATRLGLPYRETSVDETFHVWGIPEGGYLELPFGGPGTQRDWTGWVLDQVLDPAYYVLPVEAANTLVALAGLDLVTTRYELDPALVSIYDESTDSYTALRISYLQAARARLQGGADLEALEDPYADF